MSLSIRRGGYADLPPSPEVFGPRPSVEHVRTSFWPRTVTQPSGSITVNPGSFTQALLNSSGIGAKFWLTAGTHTVTSGLQPLTNQEIWCESGAIIDGGRPAAGTFLVAGPSSGVQIHGGTWQNQGGLSSPGWDAAILITGGITKGSWLVEDAVIQGNYQCGIHVQAPNCVIRRCRVINNGRQGMSASDDTSGDDAASNLLVEYVEIAWNNTRLLTYTSDAAGAKFIPASDSEFRYIYSHDNRSGVVAGLWWDYTNQNVSVHDNVIENNATVGGPALFYEISFGGADIHHNYLRNNGAASDSNYPWNGIQIGVSCSPSDGSNGGPNTQSLIYNNDIDTSGYQTPILLWNWDHDDPANRTRNWYVHHNRIFIRGASGQSRTGLAEFSGATNPKYGEIGQSPGSPSFNLFNYNEYHVADIGGSYWEHDTAYNSPGALTWAQFKARGHETNSADPVVI